jgi:hypothetical protein
MENRKRQMEEEKRVIDSLGKASCEKFQTNLNLYTKFYSEYLDEPKAKYLSQNDLKVQVKSSLTEKFLNAEVKELPLMKQITSLLKGPIMLKRNSSNISSRENDKANVDQSPRVKFAVDKLIKRESFSPPLSKRDFELGETTERLDSEEDAKGRPKSRLFADDIARAEKNKVELAKVNSLIDRKVEMTKEEEHFLKLVKGGKELEVYLMLRSNGELAKISDRRNETPLHWAIKRGYAGIVGALCDQGADLEALDMAGRKPWDLVHDQDKKEIIHVFELKQWKYKRGLPF